MFPACYPYNTRSYYDPPDYQLYYESYSAYHGVRDGVGYPRLVLLPPRAIFILAPTFTSSSTSAICGRYIHGAWHHLGRTWPGWTAVFHSQEAQVALSS